MTAAVSFQSCVRPVRRRGGWVDVDLALHLGHVDELRGIVDAEDDQTVRAAGWRCLRTAAVGDCRASATSAAQEQLPRRQ